MLLRQQQHNHNHRQDVWTRRGPCSGFLPTLVPMTHPCWFKNFFWKNSTPWYLISIHMDVLYPVWLFSGIDHKSQVSKLVPNKLGTNSLKYVRYRKSLPFSTVIYCNLLPLSNKSSPVCPVGGQRAVQAGQHHSAVQVPEPVLLRGGRTVSGYCMYNLTVHVHYHNSVIKNLLKQFCYHADRHLFYCTMC